MGRILEFEIGYKEIITIEGVMSDEHGFEAPVVIKTKTCRKHVFISAPTGIRTPVVALKGLRPSPLDDGGRLPIY
jgi:hypothetical protein